MTIWEKESPHKVLPEADEKSFLCYGSLCYLPMAREKQQENGNPVGLPHPSPGIWRQSIDMGEEI